jgi:hypothetical protein
VIFDKQPLVEMTSIPAPVMVDGHRKKPMEGVCTFEKRGHPLTHDAGNPRALAAGLAAA